MRRGSRSSERPCPRGRGPDDRRARRNTSPAERKRPRTLFPRVRGRSSFGADDGNRTRVICLEGRGSTIELRPRRTRKRAGTIVAASGSDCESASVDQYDSLVGDPDAGVWRSLVARLLWEQDVAGSNPVTPTTRKRPDCNEKLQSGRSSPPSIRASAPSAIASRTARSRAQKTRGRRFKRDRRAALLRRRRPRSGRRAPG